jgi:cyclopropane-fatty-acyl-phospholipid synthase
MLRRAKSLASHTPQKDAEQIRFHYDVSDDFYALWLDPRRVYSCAYYREPDMTLAQAQEAKLDHICRKLMLRPGERFLDIGAGWGGLLLWAAEHYGVQRHRHHAVEEPARLREPADRGEGPAGPRAHAAAGLPRPAGGAAFDKIASVGMFEHVGQANMAGLLRQDPPPARRAAW